VTINKIHASAHYTIRLSRARTHTRARAHDAACTECRSLEKLTVRAIISPSLGHATAIAESLETRRAVTPRRLARIAGRSGTATDAFQTRAINRSVSGGRDDGRDDLATVRFTLLVRPRFVTVPHAAEGLAVSANPKPSVGSWRDTNDAAADRAIEVCRIGRAGCMPARYDPIPGIPGQGIPGQGRIKTNARFLSSSSSSN